ncbi:MAG: serine hydrolase [Flavobacteriaceae bacterium]|nr:serine hydrolase [Flavobacteriaceae bacterium]
MKHINHLSLLLLLLFFIPVEAQDDPRFDGIDTVMKNVLDSVKAPSFAVAVVEKDKVVFAKGYGYRDLENKIPADENTLYAIGSCSKSFTSAILGQLQQEGKLSLDDSPIDHVPDLRFFNDDLNNQIIIKDLMAHRTGLPRHDFSWYLFPTFDKDSLLQRIKYQEPFTGLRQQWYYNNFMFLTQGVIAERITGKSWEDNVKERFFKPLGMNRSNTTIDELEKSSNKAIGYELKKDSTHRKMDYYRIAGMRPAGSINSSVSDMSKWVMTWINNGKHKEEQILPEAYRIEAMSSQMVVGAALPQEDLPDAHFSNYGYGWFLTSYKGHYRVEHGGNIDGFSASTSFFPSDSIGIVVLTNHNGSAIPGIVRNTMADRMLDVKRTDWLQEFVDQVKESQQAQTDAEENSESGSVSNTKPSHILNEFTGTYSHPGYGEFKVAEKNDSLYAHFKLMNFYLKHVHYDVFQPIRVRETGIDTTDTTPLRLNFTSNDMGDISHVRMKIEPTIDPVEFKRTPMIIEVDKETLERYTGEYILSGLTVKIYIKGEDTLYLFVEGQPEYELLPTGPHKFSFKILDGFKVEFLETDMDKVQEIMVIQPQGNFKAKRKE